MSSSAWIIRRAKAADASEVARIYNAHVDAGGVTFDTVHWQVEPTTALLATEPPDVWLVGQVSEQLHGWASVRRFSNRFGYRFSCESAIYLDPIALGTGLASALQQQIEQHCLDSGLHHAVARIVTSNRRSIAFHERFGYETVGVQREIGRLNDQWVDVTIMQKIFS